MSPRAQATSSSLPRQDGALAQGSRDSTDGPGSQGQGDRQPASPRTDEKSRQRYAVREFTEDEFPLFATEKGTIKKTGSVHTRTLALAASSRSRSTTTIVCWTFE